MTTRTSPRIPLLALLRPVLAERPDRAIGPILAALAAIATGHAMSLHHRLDWAAFPPWMIAAAILLALAIILPAHVDRLLPAPSRETILVTVLALGITWGAYELLTVPEELPIPAPAGRWLEGSDARTLVVVAWLLAVTGLRREAPLGRWHVPALLAVMTILGVWLIKVITDPPIDVWVYQRDAVNLLAAGGNPYAMDIPNIYGHDDYYGEGVVVDGRVTYGYPYLPITLLFYLPAGLLGGDPRYGNLVALILAAGLIAGIRPGRIARGAAGLLLLTPTVLFILRFSWTEPIVLFLLALTVAAAVRAPRLTGLALGLFLTAKQYCLVAIPLALLLVRRGGERRQVTALAAGALVAGAVATLPFALWDVAAFANAIIEIGAHTTMRMDSLGFGPQIARAAGGDVPGWIPFGAAGIVALVGLLAAPRTPSGFALVTGATLYAFFLLARQSFPNYYFLIVGALVLAIATARPGGDRPAEAEAAAEPEPEPPPDLVTAPVAMTEPAGRGG